jgi:hypothetical protein
VKDYPSAIANAWCDRMAECCQIEPGSFERDKCVNTVSVGLGPDRVNTYLSLYAIKGDGGVPASIAFNPSLAAECVQMQRTRSCISDGPERRDLYTTCLTALQGTLLPGAPCTLSVECRANNYCATPSDGGAGVCTPLVSEGQACADPIGNSDQCTYLGIHDQGTLHCGPLGDSGITGCSAGLPNGRQCRSDQWCASEVCSTVNGLCAGSQTYPSPAVCTLYTKVTEAGTDGD